MQRRSYLIATALDGTPFLGISTPDVHAIAFKIRVANRGFPKFRDSVRRWFRIRDFSIGTLIGPADVLNFPAAIDFHTCGLLE